MTLQDSLSAFIAELQAARIRPFLRYAVATPANDTLASDALSHCHECGEWISSPCAYTACPFRGGGNG